ncbi:HAL/PAL/TAL family ammonia-lyase [Owenweeksia hongkongensis]|uniref:Histidine ammonia-lyase n=1 Tax=Owenweeksia hongkongensis (strain DSM 17368 / CIP 108786 / JCM 12287 / NRRL B-23963 / UST20020801) TaxID=926562 RepID=G8R627_OWEHD|nr:aromatic amino acid ammonia-lyase [Owenweeksia hongkongensis]AEV32217.1 histidine ammonia-lyase [Owenweeksia hongkongensis DSM 17368]
MQLKDFEKFFDSGASFSVSDDTFALVEKSHQFLTDFSKDKIIYGINTGFGPMAQYKISKGDQEQLQYNLVRSHATGQGLKLDDEYVRAVMLCRINTLSLGHSGVSLGVIKQLETYIQNDICPVIPEHGSVGASGDLVQLAHLALGLIGEGKCSYKGNVRPVADVLNELNLEPLKLSLRDGLALINGTSCMSGIGMINLLHSTNLLSWTTLTGAIINELVEAYDDSFSKELNQVKKHRGQNQIAAAMRASLSDSKRIRKREDHLFKTDTGGDVIPNKEKVQEYYSFRCIPQVLGPIYDSIKNAKSILEEEISSANDNPIIDLEKQNVYHGGNFHGDYVAYEMDKLKIGITKLSMLCERQLNYLMNHQLNDRFPPFMNLGKLGLNFGVQGVQFTATSTTAENQTLSFPMSVHSIPNNNDNQDIVSMGSNAALMAKKVIDNSFQVLAIEAVAIAQAIDYIDEKEKLSANTLKFHKMIRNFVGTIKDDRFLAEEIAQLTNHLQGTKSFLQVDF